MVTKAKKDDHYGHILPKKSKTPKEDKVSKKELMMADVTHSDIPKTPEEKRMWIQARRFVAKETGRYSDKDIPWGLVVKIYKNQVKSGHVMHDKDVEHAKESKTVRGYKDPEKARKAKESHDKKDKSGIGKDKVTPHHEKRSEKSSHHYHEKGSKKKPSLDNLKKKYRG